MSLNILYHHRTQGRGAEGHHIASIVREMRGMGHRVTVLSPSGIDPLDEQQSAPVDKTRVATGGIQSVWKWISRHAPNFVFELAEIAYNVSAYRRMSKALAADRYDLVYERYAFYLVAGAALAARRRIPFVLEANEVSGIAGRARRQTFPRLCGAVEGFLLRRCTAILAVSSHLRERILLKGVAAASVHVVPNAFSTERLPETHENQDLEAKLGLEGSTVLGFAGWFDTWDRLDSLLENFSILRKDYPRLKLLLIGDGAVMPELRRQARRLNIEADVVFTGAVPRKDVYRYLSLLDIAVLTHSNDFGSPVVMFEFMGLKIPVVAPRLAPILDVHRHESTALLFAPLDGADCRRQLERLIRSETLRQEIAAQAHAKLLADHTWKGNAELILSAAGLAAGLKAGLAPVSAPEAP